MVPSSKPQDYCFFPVVFSFVVLRKSLQTIHPYSKLFVTGGFQFNEGTHNRNVLHMHCLISAFLFPRLPLVFRAFLKRKVSFLGVIFHEFPKFQIDDVLLAHSLLFLFWELFKLKRFSIIRNFSARIGPKNLLNKLWATCVIFMKKAEGQTRKI